MYPVLAVEIDLVSLGAIILSIITGVGAFLRMVWNGGTKITDWAKPRVEKVVESHNSLVTNMAESVPVLKDSLQAIDGTLKKLSETQEQQMVSLRSLHDASERHEQMHQRTGQKIDHLADKITSLVLIGHASNVNLPVMEPKPGESGVIIQDKQKD
jgi:hypothetical protein